MISTRQRDLIIFSLLGMFALSAFLWTVDDLPGISPDSMTYINGAKSILNGNGFYNGELPITHYPPLYSVFLALFGLIGKDVLSGSQIFHALIFTMNALLIYGVVHYLTQKNILFSIASFFTFIFSTDLFSLHTMAWSEPLFLSLLLLALLFLMRYEEHSKNRDLIILSLFVGAALVTRYVGVTLIPPVMLSLMSLMNLSIKKRIKDTILFTFLSILPLLLVLLYNSTVTGNATNRDIYFHPFTLFLTVDLIKEISNFFIPYSSHLFFSAGLCIALIILFVFILLKIYPQPHICYKDRAPIKTLHAFSIFFIFTYILFLIFSISFIDAHTPINGRILSPIHCLLTIFIPSIAWLISQRVQQRGVLILVLLVLITPSVTKIQTTLFFAIDFHKNGWGYSSKKLRDSDAIRFANTQSPHAIIYSNGPDLLSFWTNKSTRMIPHKYKPTTMQKNEMYEKEMGDMLMAIRQEKASLIYLYVIQHRSYLPGVKEIFEYCDTLDQTPLKDAMVWSHIAIKNNE